MREQFERSVRSKGCYLYLLLATTLGIGMAWGIGTKLALPIAMTLVLYPVYALDLAQGRRNLAAAHTFFWAFVSSLCVLFLVQRDDARMAGMIFRSISYRDEMFQWILTGRGAEGDIQLFLPQHLKHFALFCIASLLTGGVWGLTFGAILINYMNFYVGSLLLHTHHPHLVVLFGWPIWSLLRVVGFVLCGIALSEPLLSQFFRRRLEVRQSMRFFGLGLAFIVGDILLKATLASFWRDLLRRAVSF